MRRFRTLADAGCHFELRQMADLRANEHIVGDVPIASVLNASAQGQWSNSRTTNHLFFSSRLLLAL
jgi:hypothetical protein